MESWGVLRQTSEPHGDLYSLVPNEAMKSFRDSMARYIIDDSHGFWLEPEAGDGHCDPQKLVITLGQRICELGCAYNGEPTQSPIEDMLLGALLWIDKDWGGMPKFCLLSSPQDVFKNHGEREQIDFWLTTQGAVGAYRTDFLLWFTYKRVVAGVAVECDGHDFHERTKEQAARDKKRDREILKAGFPVIRFTGSEVFKSPYDCAQQVSDLLGDALDRVSRAAGLYA